MPGPPPRLQSRMSAALRGLVTVFAGQDADATNPRAELLHGLRPVFTADRPVQGWATRVHAGTAQYRGRNARDIAADLTAAFGAVLLTTPAAISRQPSDLGEAIEEAWRRVRAAPGF